MIITYNSAAEGQTPNPEWEAYLASVPTKFRELKRKARQAIAPKPLIQAPSTSRV
jgi:hypothetical protein